MVITIASLALAYMVMAKWLDAYEQVMAMERERYIAWKEQEANR